MGRYAAFDFGAESGRAIVGMLEQGRITLHEAHRFPNPSGRMNGQLQWDLLGQWEQIKTGLRKSADLGPIDAIGVDTWGVDFGLLGADGQVLGNPVCYRDPRTDGMLDLAFSLVPQRDIFEATGIQFMQLNTLYQLLAMRRAGASALAGATTLLFMPDLFNYLMTGVARSEFSIATTSQCYDPRRREWAIDLLRRLEIPTHIFAPIVASGTVLGPLREDIRKECGVGPIPVIAPCGHDTGCAVVAVPAEADDWCYLSSGTWSLMGVELPEPVISYKSYQYNYTNEGGFGGSIRFLKNIAGLWLVQECRREFARQGREYDYAALTAMAAGAQAMRSLVDPNAPQFVGPGQMPQKIADFCRQTHQPVPADDAAMVRCCLDSLAMEYRRTLDGLEDVLGRRLATIHIVGGGSQNELLNQLTADACERTVLAGPVEATACGNILAQAIATGELPGLEAAREVVRSTFAVRRYRPVVDLAAERKRYAGVTAR